MFDKQKIITLIDLTSLNESDRPEDIIALCDKAKRASVAAVCIYAQFVTLAKNELKGTDIKVATVVNFPAGNMEIHEVEAEIKSAIDTGVDEIDLVIPYQDYIQEGRSDKAIQLVKACKTLCADRVLKVIIESGELASPERIKKAALDSMLAGADFIKTSTGKTSEGANLAAVEIMLSEIKQYQITNAHWVGCKVSGGVRTYEDACQYLSIAQAVLDKSYISNTTFRFGASGLLDNLLGNEIITKHY